MSTVPKDEGSPRHASSGVVIPDVVDTWDGAVEGPGAPLIICDRLGKVMGESRPPAVERIDAGHSNPTFLVTGETGRWILRRPPRPPFAPRAHDVLREYRILHALRDQPVRTPLPLLACEDLAVFGAPFYLMEALDGIVLREVTPHPLDAPAERERAGVELVDALAELHAVAPGEAGLGDPAWGEKYLQRQLDLWTTQWEGGRTREIPALDEVTRLLRAGQPVTPRVAVVHGDYKLDNVFFAREAPAKLIAILDWEMATLGDPLADLGYLTATWTDAGEPATRIAGLSTATMQEGFPTRRALADRYARDTGLDLSHLDWYQALALWKLAILLEASYRRFQAGTDADPFFATLAEGVPEIAEQALGAARGALV